MSVSLHPEEMQALERIAVRNDRSLSQAVARAIRFYLAETNRGSKDAVEFEMGGEVP